VGADPMPLLGELPLFTSCLERLSEKGTSNGPSEDLAAIRSAKWTENLPRRPVRLRWERLRDFSDSLRGRLLGNLVNRGNGGGCLGLASIFLISLVPLPPRPPAHILRRYCIYEACDEA